MKILVTVTNKDLKNMIFPNHVQERLDSFGEVQWLSYENPQDELMNEIIDTDCCITGWGSPKITKDVLNQARKLKLIGHTAGTVRNYIDEDVFEKGIKVVNSNACLAKSTAELTLSLMLAGTWDLRKYSLKMEKGIWSENMKETVPAIYGAVVGLVGWGEISREVIKLLKNFSVRVLLHSSHCTVEEAKNWGVELCTLDYLLSVSDIISLHNTLTPQSKGMLGKNEFDKIKDGALFVNTARAPITNEAALIETLQSGRIKAALDVYHYEPVPQNYILSDLPNVLCVPHIGGFAEKLKKSLGMSITDDIERFIKGEKLKGEVTKERYQMMTPF